MKMATIFFRGVRTDEHGEKENYAMDCGLIDMELEVQQEMDAVQRLGN